jgi:hypothetical protein
VRNRGEAGIHVEIKHGAVRKTMHLVKGIFS